MIFEGILIPFAAVAISEIGDKTQLSIFLLASKAHQRIKLLIGSLIALWLVDGIAILAGSWLTNLIPVNIIRIASGIIFIIFGIVILWNHHEESVKISGDKNHIFSSFALVFVSEWGDKSQVTSGLFATQYSPVEVFIGTIGALTLLTLISIYIGKLFAEKMMEKTISKIAGVIFLMIGLSILLTASY